MTSDFGTHIFGDWTCPHCGEPNNCLAGPGQPEPGDVIVCWCCRCIHIVGDDGRPRTASKHELATAAADPYVRDIVNGMLDRGIVQ